MSTKQHMLNFSSSPWQVWEATDLSKLLDLFTITEVLPIPVGQIALLGTTKNIPSSLALLSIDDFPAFPFGGRCFLVLCSIY